MQYNIFYTLDTLFGHEDWYNLKQHIINGTT
jgi:hypothetical protein